MRSYAPRLGDAGEDAAEPLLAELTLIRESRLAGQFEFVRGPKPNLHDGVFAAVLKRFWARWHADAPTLSVEQASYGPGSPGRVFKQDEDSVMARLAKIGEITSGAIVWNDTAGLRQVSLTRKIETNRRAIADFRKLRTPAGSMTTLSEIVRVERRFALSARLDSDLTGTPPLTGYVLQASVRKSLEAMAAGIADGGQYAFTWDWTLRGRKVLCGAPRSEPRCWCR